MIFSYNWIQKYIKEDLPPVEKLARKLSLHAFEVEAYKKKGDDFILEIDITANRVSDCSSHLGLAKECAAILGLKMKLPKREASKKEEQKNILEVEVEDKEACPRYTAYLLEGVEVEESPVWLKKALESCGLQPINNIVDIANYVMLETGQPLHAFDLDKLEEEKLVVRLAREGEKIVTLDEKKVELGKNMMVIADASSPVAIAGIKGGKGPEVDENTKRIVFEAANFDPVLVRKTSQKTKIKTDASWRFEHGLDPNMTKGAVERAAYLAQEFASSGPVSQVVDFYPQNRTPSVIGLGVEEVEGLLGVSVPGKEIIRILRSLDFTVEKDKEGGLKVKVPTIRTDVSVKEDLIEEVGRIYGYDKVAAHVPSALAVPPPRNINVFWEENTRDTLKEVGFTEVYNYSFISKKQADLFGFREEELVELANPLSKKYKYLAPSLLCNLAKNTKDNLKRFKEFRIFELNKVFKSGEGGVEEKRILAGVLTQRKRERDLFFEAKGALSSLFSDMLLFDIWYGGVEPTPEESKGTVWDLSRSAEIKMRKKELGFIGFLSEKIRKKLKIGAEVVAFELDFEKLQQFASEEHEYETISPYPIATRDLAILVPRGVKMAEVLNVMNRAGGELVRDVDLFDVYEGEELPHGKKNLAFHIAYQAEDRTLSSEEINKLHQKIIKALEEEGWEVRK